MFPIPRGCCTLFTVNTSDGELNAMLQIRHQKPNLRHAEIWRNIFKSFFFFIFIPSFLHLSFLQLSSYYSFLLVLLFKQRHAQGQWRPTSAKVHWYINAFLLYNIKPERKQLCRSFQRTKVFPIASVLWKSLEKRDIPVGAPAATIISVNEARWMSLPYVWTPPPQKLHAWLLSFTILNNRTTAGERAHERTYTSGTTRTNRQTCSQIHKYALPGLVHARQHTNASVLCTFFYHIIFPYSWESLLSPFIRGTLLSFTALYIIFHYLFSLCERASTVWLRNKCFRTNYISYF